MLTIDKPAYKHIHLISICNVFLLNLELKLKLSLNKAHWTQFEKKSAVTVKTGANHHIFSARFRACTNLLQ